MAAPLIGIIVNPKSTQNTKKAGDLRELFKARSNVAFIELGEDMVADMHFAMKEMARIKPVMLVISGGDGTIMAAFTELENNHPFGSDVPPIGFLPTGKTNMIAEDFGSKGDPAEIYQKLLKLAETGFERYIEERSLLGTEIPNQPRPLYGMFFGGAAIVNGIEYCRKNIYPMKMPNIFSHTLAIFTLLLSGFFGGKKPGSAMYADHAHIHVKGGGEFEGRYIVIIATTMDRLLMGLRPYGMEGNGSIGFSAIEHQPRTIWGALKSLISGTFGRVFIQGVQTRRCEEIVIKSSDSVTLDGELYDVDENAIIRLYSTDLYRFVKLDKFSNDKSTI